MASACGALEVIKKWRGYRRKLIGFCFLITISVTKRKKQRRLDITDIFNRLKLLAILERRRYMLLKYLYKFVKIKFNHHQVQVRPTMEVVSHNSVLFKSSVRWNAINEWNSLLADRSIILDEELPDFNFTIVIMNFTYKLRSNIYV